MIQPRKWQEVQPGDWLILRGPKRRLQRGDSVQYRLNNGLWWALYTVETTDSFKREIKATYGRMRKYEHVVEALNEYQFRSLHHCSQGVSRHTILNLEGSTE